MSQNITVHTHTHLSDSGLVLFLYKSDGTLVNPGGDSLTEVPAGDGLTYKATISEELDLLWYRFDVIKDGAIVDDGYHFISRSTLATEDASFTFDADDVQGHYGLLTNFYFTGGIPTVTEIEEEDVDQWLDINFDIDAGGNFDFRPNAMKTAQINGHTGTGTQADPILFSLEGLTQSSSVNFRASLTFEPDVDESQFETRLLFNRHSGTTPSDDFAIAEVTLGMGQGADVEYDAEPMLSFFVGDTIDTNGTGDAGKCRFQIRSSVEGTLRMRALTWYIQS